MTLKVLLPVTLLTEAPVPSGEVKHHAAGLWKSEALPVLLAFETASSKMTLAESVVPQGPIEILKH